MEARNNEPQPKWEENSRRQTKEINCNPVDDKLPIILISYPFMTCLLYVSILYLKQKLNFSFLKHLFWI